MLLRARVCVCLFLKRPITVSAARPRKLVVGVNMTLGRVLCVDFFLHFWFTDLVHANSLLG